MANVAHDLKTPLFSFEADVETLMTFFNQLPPDIVDQVNDSLQNTRDMSASAASSTVEKIHPIEIFDSLY